MSIMGDWDTIRVITDGVILNEWERDELETHGNDLYKYIMDRYGSGETGKISRQFRSSGRVIRAYADSEARALVVDMVYSYRTLGDHFD